MRRAWPLRIVDWDEGWWSLGGWTPENVQRPTLPHSIPRYPTLTYYKPQEHSTVSLYPALPFPH